MGGKSTQTTTRTPYNPGAVASANDALSTANTQAQGTIAQYSPALNTALGQIQDRINTPPSYLTDARSQLNKTINGDYLNPESNPYISGIADLVAKKTQGNYNTSFGASGRSHGGMAALLSSQGVGDALQGLYANNYAAERGNQMQAVGAAPGFHTDELTDANALFSGVQNLAMLPLNAANAYGNGVTAVNSPYTTETTETKKSGGLGSILGAALTIGSSLIPGIGPAAAGAMSAAGGLLSGSGGGSGGVQQGATVPSISSGGYSGTAFTPMAPSGIGGLISNSGGPMSLNSSAFSKMRFLG